MRKTWLEERLEKELQDPEFKEMWEQDQVNKHKKAFCEICRDNVEYVVVTEPMDATVGGETYQYIGMTAYCLVCGAQLNAPGIMDHNQDALRTAIRSKKIE